ncbi:DUF6296 family protein [Kitasatospora sp. NPDC093679]|uniref:DUF6296 family protein n=1 Tax=Kitasatospora sp. NPDC093679 TaxID=3154983 RepID=UPI0034404201
MHRSKRYRPVFDGSPTGVTVIATGARGVSGAEVYTDESGTVRAGIEADGTVRSVVATRQLGRPRSAEPIVRPAGVRRGVGIGTGIRGQTH